jgi:hypothetical protein
VLADLGVARLAEKALGHELVDRLVTSQEELDGIHGVLHVGVSRPTRPSLVRCRFARKIPGKGCPGQLRPPGPFLDRPPGPPIS